MTSFNNCTMIGNLVRDPELRCAPSGSPVCEMTLAINRKSKDRKDVLFLDVVTWGKTAENCSRYLAKGSCLLVNGYLKQEIWEDRNCGEKRSKIRLVAETVQFIKADNNHDSRSQSAPSSIASRKFGKEDQPLQDS